VISQGSEPLPVCWKIVSMAKRDSFLLRITPELLEALRGWADDEFRSLNGQIECVLHRALEQAGRLPKSHKSDDPKIPPGDPKKPDFL